MLILPGADAGQGFALAETIRQADAALYEAKTRGRNRTVATPATPARRRAA